MWGVASRYECLKASCADRCLLVVVNPAAGAGSREVSIPAAERHWHEAHVSGPAAPDAEDGSGSSQQPIAVPKIDFDIAYVRTAAEAARVVQNALLQLRFGSHSSTFNYKTLGFWIMKCIWTIY